MVYRVCVEKKPGLAPECASLLSDCRSFLDLKSLENVRIWNRYDVEGIDETLFAYATNTVFSEPQLDLTSGEIDASGAAAVFAVEPLPGQFDQRADSAAQCIQLLSQCERPRIRTAKVYALYGTLSEKDVEAVKHHVINPVESREASLAKPETLEENLSEPKPVASVDGFTGMDESALSALLSSMGLAMDLDDLKTLQAYFRDEEHRDPTVTEVRVVDTYWSDHCRHTTFSTHLDEVSIENPAVKDAYDRYLAAREEVYGLEKAAKRPQTLMDIATIGTKTLKKRGLLPELDESEEINACSIHVPAKVNGEEQDWLLMFKNETHNHPTEIEPFGGAATCIGGCIRDPLSGRAYVHQAMRVTGGGDPRKTLAETLPGKLPQRKLAQTAAAGYSSYGNQIGLATGHVAELYHEGYIAKRLECGAVVAAAPAKNVVRERPAPGDVVILLGGRTGRDGIGGATGSSKSHDMKSLTTMASEVQKGNAPEERKIQRLFRNGEVTRLIKRCNDFGAGGVSVAIGELADGLEIELDAVRKKYEGLDGTELAISESQERMAVVVAPEDEAKFIAAAQAENLEAYRVAVVTESPRMVMHWRGQTVADLSRAFLDTNGVRQHVTAVIAQPDTAKRYLAEVPAAVKACGSDAKAAWLTNLQDLNVCSQKGLAERFDSTIGGNTVLMPFGGKTQLTPAEGMVAKLPVLGAETTTATAMTFGLNPAFTEWSPFHGALYSVVEAAAKMVALGGDAAKIRLTFQEYFESLGKDPAKWGNPFAALIGALWAQHELGIAAIGGKDSMSGTFEHIHVPPTLAAFAVDVMKADRAVSPEFKQAGSRVYVVPAEKDEQDLPVFPKLRANFEKIRQLTAAGKVRAAQSIGVGGIAAAVTKMALGNRIGFAFAKEMTEEQLYCADYGTIVLELADDVDVSAALAETGAYELGQTTAEQEIRVNGIAVSIKEAEKAYTTPLEKIFPTQTKKVKGEVSYAPYTKGNGITAATKIARPHVIIPVFPGTNCEYDSARAWERAGATAETIVVRNLTPTAVEETVEALVNGIKRSQIIMLPGGFSGGDEPDGSGKFIAAMFRNPRIKEEVMALLQKRDGLMLGICNGFQALIKLGLVPYGEIRDLSENSPTLTHNTIGRHASCMVDTRVISNLSPWFNNVKVGDVHTIAISHGEGRFVADAETVKRLQENGQIATQYVDAAGNPSLDIPFNPNGSVDAIEGITSPDGRVLGKMGHSERIGEDVAKNVPGSKDQQLFEAGVRYYK